jgi:hypothetical protein
VLDLLGVVAYHASSRTQRMRPILTSTGTLPMATRTDTEIRELDAGRELVDEQARKYLGISGEEFIRRWEAGEIDADEDPDVMRVAMLFGFAR